MSIRELVDLFTLEGYTAHIRQGARLIITGGDPLIQQAQVLEFLKMLRGDGIVAYVEIETEGIIVPESPLEQYIGHCNVSPKLSNSAMLYSARIKPGTLGWHNKRPQDIFKFPVANRSDAMEALDICEKHGIIDRERIFFMPVCDSRDSQDRVGPIVAELAKELHVGYSPRLHLQLWNKKTGV
jgi:7-carboxy-7-deazaguanine synthase